MVWGIIGAGVASALGGYLTNKSNQKFAQKNSDTAHQREVADLRAAGLNPILSATGGNGASTPTFQAVNPLDDLPSAVSSAMQLRLQEKSVNSTVGLQSAEQEMHLANAEYLRQRSMTEVTQRALYQAQTSLTEENAKLARQQYEKVQPLLMKKIGTEIDMNKATAEEKRAHANLMKLDASLRPLYLELAWYQAESGRISANAAVTSANAAMINANAQADLVVKKIANMDIEGEILGQKRDFNEKYPTGYARVGSTHFGPIGQSPLFIPPNYN